MVPGVIAVFQFHPLIVHLLKASAFFSVSPHFRVPNPLRDL